MTQVPAIRLSSVSKRFTTSRGEVAAVEDVSLEVAQGEFVSLVGPSGCGKTTLLKMAAGLLGQTSGSIETEGRLGTPSPTEMGFVFQQSNLLPWYSVIDNILLPAKIQRLDLTALRARAIELLEQVGLDPAIAKRRPTELSGGMQQRVAIVRALVHGPDLLYMDEPFGALDALTRDRINVDLQSIHMDQKKTVLFVTHSISEAVFLSDRVVVMSKGPGRIVELLDIDIPRPRRFADASDGSFQTYEHRLRELLEVDL